MRKFVFFLQYARIRQRLIVLVLLFGISNSVWAGIDPPVVQALDGSLNQLNLGATVMVEDPKYFNPLDTPQLARPYVIKNMVALELNEGLNVTIPSAFNAYVSANIIVRHRNNTIDSFPFTFYIGYSAPVVYNNKHAYFFEDGVQVTMRVTNLTTDADWNVWAVLKLTNTLQSFPMYKFDCSDNAITAIYDSMWLANTNKDELPVYWSPGVGADEYDLEWTYIDSSAYIGGQYGDTAMVSINADRIFENNATRVTITGTSYNIPLIYDNKGYLFFRVRPVQWQAGGGRNEADWSSDHLPGGLGRFLYNGHERSLNWQATTSYAEEGKRKVVVQYYDGSLRARQTVTKDNSTNQTIVAESFYDYQGRPVVQVLPAPTLNTIIGYSQNFNRNLSGNPYDKRQFDTLPDPSAYCGFGAEAMDTSSGTSQYYSHNNPLRDSSFHKFIPDAEGFPFTEVEYAQDNTGRVSRQSGVGKTFRIGSGHETKYFYGTPDQRELDALFGTEVGDRSHYFKTMVRDANGQYSVSYTDMHGRTIATALAGAKPDSANLDTLASCTKSIRTEKLSDPASAVIKDFVMESKKGLLVTKGGNHTFNYQLNPQTLKKENCNTDSICYECLYDLEITITDDCNNQKLGGAPFDTIVHNFSLASIDTTCGNGGFSLTFTKFLPEGSYEVTKRLSVSKAGLDFYRDSIFMKANTCKNIDSFINEQRRLLSLVAQCRPTCQSCNDSVGTWPQFWARFRQTTGINDVDTPAYKNMAMQAYADALEDCKVLCDTATSEFDDIRRNMLTDMMPSSGQYADINRSNNDTMSVFFSSIDGDAPDTTAKYRSNAITYKDADGSPDLVWDESVSKLVRPQDLSPEVFIQKFKNSWAEALLPFHPEYCKLTKYELLNASNVWNKRFEATDSYAEARSKGYLDPTHGSGNPFIHFGATGTPDYDPIRAFDATLKADLEDSIRNFRAVTDPDDVTLTHIDMWTMATLTAKCPAGPGFSSCFAIYKYNGRAFKSDSLCDGELDMAWRAFRQMYLDVKRNRINLWLKDQCSGSLTAIDLMNSGHQPNFSDANELLTADGVDLPTEQSSTSSAQSQYNSQIAVYYDANCRAYVTDWVKSLSVCSFYNPDSLEDVIIPRLIDVCKEGSDVGHPYGASSVKPGSANPYHSFEEVINDYNATHSITDKFNCTAVRIKAPRPYNQQTVYSRKPTFRGPDSCECSVISGYYTKFLASGFGSFSDFMKQVYQTSITDSVLNILKSYCSIGGASPAACQYVQKPLMLPPAFQCYTGDVCISCQQFKTLDSAFRNEFPQANPVVTDSSITDTIQLRWNELYEQYMNYHLGFSKTIQDYFTFADKCNAGNPHLPCDSLNQLLTDFKLNYRQNYGIDVSFNVQGGPSISDLHQLIHNGTIIQLPDTTRNGSYTGFHGPTFQQRGGLTYCWKGGYAIEFKVRVLLDVADLGVFYASNGNFDVTFQRFPNAFTYNSISHPAGTYLTGFSDPHYSIQQGHEFGDVGFDYILVDSNANAIGSFMTFKLQSAKSHYYLYVKGVQVADISRNPALPIIESGSFGFAFGNLHGAMDWVRMTDSTGATKYFEDFLDADNPVVVANDYFCPSSIPDCPSAFVGYYNSHKGTSYNYSQIDSIYQATCGVELNPCPDTTANLLANIRNAFINDYYNHGRKYDANGCDIGTWTVNYGSTFNNTSLVPHKDIFKDGYMRFPDSSKAVNYDFNTDSACVNRHFSIEFRFKAPVPIGQSNLHKIGLELFFSRNEALTQKYFLHIGDDGDASYRDDINAPNNFLISHITEFDQDYTDWSIVKFEFVDSLIKFYYNGILKKTLTFPTGVVIDKLYHFDFGDHSFSQPQTYFDWVKAYDGSGNMFYFEDFNSCGNFSVFAPYIHCDSVACSQVFTYYYRHLRGGSLNFTQLDSMYTAHHISLNVCDAPNTNNITLCGRAEVLAAPAALDAIDNCSDSTFFILSKAQELNNAYTDSLKGHFDSSYLAKCLQAYKFETFTVRDTLREYHYTLYYYDQAGNLLKTVSPAGVHPNYDSLWLDSVYNARLAGTVKIPTHTLVTQYRYNTLSQVTSQKSPDGGKTDFWYDRLGRLTLSRNARQLAAGKFYSYTNYDILGRITEVGQIRDTSSLSTPNDSLTRHESPLQSWFTNLVKYRGQVTNTIYDIPYPAFIGDSLLIDQRNLRNRVSYLTYTDTPGVSSAYNNGTFYSYDIHGNVDTLLQDYGQKDFVANIMNTNGNRWKKFIYQYDLISGKVNMVMYQHNWMDRWYHRYTYDAENRLTMAETSLDSLVWEKDARYEYYRHGPLARTVIGDQQVQGLDYAYTLQGWLKGINSTGGQRNHDMGEDGQNGALHQFTGRDAYALTLNYFGGEYASINHAVNPFPDYRAQLSTAYRPLFNGNISSSSVYSKRFEDPDISGGPNIFYNYRYDQLNRLTGQDAYIGFDTALNNWSSWTAMPGDRLQERVAYDANGNILKYFRNALGGSSPDMDSLNYYYYPGTNQLRRVTDAIPDNQYRSEMNDIIRDLDNQPENNYAYDQIGNLIKDSLEQISNIKWSVYGKILEVTRTATDIAPSTTIKFTYDAQGNRISKVTDAGGELNYTWYVRDAQGNVITTYTANGNDPNLWALPLSQSERYMYGSSRLGVYSDMLRVDGPDGADSTGPDRMWGYNENMFLRGLRQYELTNHLGNVLATISDKKFAVLLTGNDSLADYFEPDIRSAFDYYPFGMMSRIAPNPDDVNYRYGFNGKEMDHEVKGATSSLDYGFRIYDPRVGRFLSVDPLLKSFAMLSPYQYASNSPILNFDFEGLSTEPTTTEGQRKQVELDIFYSYGSKKVTRNMYYHAGGLRLFKGSGGLSKAGWYTEEEYKSIIGSSGLSNDLAGYMGMFRTVRKKNWTDEEKANMLNSRLGQFLAKGISEEGGKLFIAAANECAQYKNSMEIGNTYASAFNVEDLLGLASLLKEGFSALGKALIKESSHEVTGGLNLYKFNSPQAVTSEGWKTGDRFLFLPDQGSTKLNWMQNYGALRREMNLGKPIYDSYVLPNGNIIPSGGFLNMERFTLQSRGWTYNPVQRAWLPPAHK